ncbi:MAG: hypothetical protein QXQ20_08470 [Candidatus Nezhaarchaeales archaeon]
MYDEKLYPTTVSKTIVIMISSLGGYIIEQGKRKNVFEEGAAIEVPPIGSQLDESPSMGIKADIMI